MTFAPLGIPMPIRNRPAFRSVPGIPGWTLCLAGVGSAGVPDVLVLRARLYDRNYGDFSGDFNETGVFYCSCNVMP